MRYNMNHESLTQDNRLLTIHPIMATIPTSQVTLSSPGELDVFLRHPRDPFFTLITSYVFSLITSEVKVVVTQVP